MKSINPINPSSTNLINNSNLNYNSPIILPPISQLLSNNNYGRNVPLFNFPGNQFKQEFSTNANIFKGSQHFPLFPQQQSQNTLGNSMIGQNISQIMPKLSKININGNNSINNNLENNEKNNMKNN